MNLETRRTGPSLFTDADLNRLLDSLGDEIPGRPHHALFSDAHSNDLAELTFDDGRTLVVKRARVDWAAPRFAAAHVAGEMLDRQGLVVAPRHFSFPAWQTDPASRPVTAYWRIPFPTLAEVWPNLNAELRRLVLQSWGRLVRRIHDVEFAGHGWLAGMEEGGVALADFLEADLVERLLPAIRYTWPEAIGSVDRVIGAIGRVAERVGAERGRLIHNDLHMGNILCSVETDGVRCVGVLDLEAVFSGPPEADLAALEVMHGPHFTQEIAGDWIDHVGAGYGERLDPFVLAFFRAHHLLNMGFHSALVGHHAHAAQVAGAVRAETTSPVFRGRAVAGVAAVAGGAGGTASCSDWTAA